MIRKTKDKEEWCVYSEKGKSLGCYPSESKAQERLRQVEFFKHKSSYNVAQQKRNSKCQ